MEEGDDTNAGRPKRARTDSSLRAERGKADANAAARSEVLDEEADEVVRIARERADKVIQAARDEADRARSPRSGELEGSAGRARDRADELLEQERGRADARISSERSKRKRFLADFLAVERDATDKDLTGERTDADTVIAARDEFLAIVSHDLRTLLSGLAMNVDLLVSNALAGATGDKIRKHGATSGRLVARMNRLINDLIDIASIEAGRLALLHEQVEVASIVGDTLEAFAPIAASKRIDLEADAAGVPLHARLDGDRILQVLANLVSNAIKFTPVGGRIAIRVRLEGEGIHFTVSDTGVGIAASALQGVFERFRQVSTDRRGLGLGLHISKCIIEAHGGRMWAESELGIGSTFHFAVPASPS